MCGGPGCSQDKVLHPGGLKLPSRPRGPGSEPLSSAPPNFWIFLPGSQRGIATGTVIDKEAGCGWVGLLFCFYPGFHCSSSLSGCRWVGFLKVCQRGDAGGVEGDKDSATVGYGGGC